MNGNQLHFLVRNMLQAQAWGMRSILRVTARSDPSTNFFEVDYLVRGQLAAIVDVLSRQYGCDEVDLSAPPKA